MKKCMNKIVSRAIIVVCSRGAERDETISQYFKPLIGRSGRQRNFLDGRISSEFLEERKLKCVKDFIYKLDGCVLLRSPEEKELKCVKDFVYKFADLRYLVCVARPEYEKVSLFKILKKELENKGYIVTTIIISHGKSELYYKSKAQEIFDSLQFRSLVV